jgi:HD-like signal output (HDOD) protein
MRRLLFVDDEPRILDALQRMLRPQRHEWDMHFAAGPAAAIAVLDATPVDVIVTDMRMPEMDGATLLELVMRKWPSTVRIVLSGQTEVAAAERTVRVAHQFISKPCEPGDLFAIIERLCMMRDLLGDGALRDAVGTVETVPSLPAQYAELERIVRGSAAVLPSIAAIVERDPGLCAKVLQLVNSSFFGRPRRITRIEHAVGLLGVNVLRSLILSHDIAQSFSGAGLAGVISLDAERTHAVLTGAVARRLSQTPADGDVAFVAGVLHDVGKLLLAAKLPDYFRAVVIEAGERGVPLHVVEREQRGAAHPEIGAYLLGLWGLPVDIVTAVAHHHRPSAAGGAYARLVAEVHIADALVTELVPGSGVPFLDEPWLEAQGMLGEVQAARELARTVIAAEAERA